MATTRRDFLREIAAVSVLAGIPGIGLAKDLFKDRANYLAVLHIGGLNTNSFGLPSSFDGLMLTKRFLEKQDIGVLRSKDLSSEMIMIKTGPKSSQSNKEPEDQTSSSNIFEIEPIGVDQIELQKSNYLIREIGDLQTGIIGLALQAYDSNFYEKVDQVNEFASRLKTELGCKKIFCLLKTVSNAEEKALVEHFTQLTTEVTQVFCNVGYEDKKTSMLKSIFNAKGSSVLLSLNQKKNPDILQIGFRESFIERFESIELA